ncbi:MAG: molybdopterin synthase sulfur carrier subunit [Chloroflexi bacterium HGW-Chloroflexi-2]|jgi:molybdopterin converting factor small subunit|nr:MAG: molybdopterin synthase sulfur carrier subunit [Chloroflexi bacterium HGW-Chloroflexi-2]
MKVVGDIILPVLIVCGHRILYAVRDDMIVKVKLFATLRKYLPGVELGKSSDIELESGSSIAQLYDVLGIPAEEIKLAYVNGIFCEMDTELKDGDEIGIFPPIGGGSL